MLNPQYPINFFETKKNYLEVYVKINKSLKTQEKVNWNNKLLFPGEIIFPSLNITQLSYCELLESNDSNITYKIQALTQCAASNPSKYLHSNSFKSFNLTGIYSETIPEYKPATLIEANQLFINTSLTLLNTPNNITIRGILKRISFNLTKKNQFVYFIINESPLNTTDAEFQKPRTNTTISHFTSQNQYVEAYTTIATIDNFVSEKLIIRDLKNLNQRTSRILIVTDKEYKNYRIKKNSHKRNLKFITVGDKIKEKEFASYSGYVTHLSSPENLHVRMSIPFFISLGTRLLVQHGSLIREQEPFCQLIYNHVISNDILS